MTKSVKMEAKTVDEAVRLALVELGVPAEKAMVDILDDAAQVEDFMRMEKWIFDSPDQAGEMLRQFVNQFYKGNGFVNGGIRVGPRAPTLKDVTMPVLNISRKNPT